MLIREALIVPNSFQSLHSSQKRASSGRDGFIEITLTDSHLLSFLRQLAPDAQSGRHDPSRRSCAPPFIRTSIPCSALRRRAGAIRTSRRNANSCFPPYPAHGPQDAIGKEGDSLNSSPKVHQTSLRQNTSEKCEKPARPCSCAGIFHRKTHGCQKRRIWLVDGPFQSPDQGRESAGRCDQQSRRAIGPRAATSRPATPHARHSRHIHQDPQKPTDRDCVAAAFRLDEAASPRDGGSPCGLLVRTGKRSVIGGS